MLDATLEQNKSSLLQKVLTFACAGAAVGVCALSVQFINEPIVDERFRQDALASLLAFVFAFWLVGSLLAWRLRGPVAVLLVSSALGVIAFGPVATLTVLLAFAASLCVGGAMMKLLNVQINSNLDRVIAVCLGLSFLSTIIFAIARFPVNSPQTYAAILACMVAIGWFGLGKSDLVRLFRDVSGTSDAPASAVSSRLVAIVFWGLLFAVAALLLTVARLPEVGNDQLLMHLYIPRMIAAEGRFAFDPQTYQVGYFPFGGGWLYTYGVMFAGDIGADAFNAAFAILTAALIYLLVSRAAGAVSGLIGAILFLSAPIVFYVSTLNFQENHLALLSLAAFAAVWRFVDGGERGWSAIFAALIGAATAAKLLGLVWALPMGLWLLVGIGLRRQYAGDIGYLFLWPVLLFIAFAAGPYVLAMVETGNPVFPFYNEIFRSPLAPQTNLSNALFASPPTLLSLATMSLNSAPYLESTGPTFAQFVTFLAPLMMLSFFVKGRRLALPAFLLAFVYIMVVGQEQNYLRYFYPALPLLAVACALGAGFALSAGLLVGGVTSLALASTVGSQILYAPGSNIYARKLPPQAFFAPDALTRLRDERAPDRSLAQLATKLTAKDDKILFVYRPFIADVGSQAAVLHPFYGPELWQDFQKSAREDLTLDFMRRHDFQWVVYWPGANYPFAPRFRKMLLDSADRVSELNGVGLYRIRDNIFFPEQVMDIPAFPPTNPAGWNVMDGVYLNNGIVGVTGSQLASYNLPHETKDALFLETRYRCRDTRGFAIMQVNWRDANFQLVSVDIRSTECGEGLMTERRVFRPPPGATIASVIFSAPSKQVIYFEGVRAWR